MWRPCVHAQQHLRQAGAVRQHQALGAQLLCPLPLVSAARALCLQLRLIRRAFVNKMLDSSTFNKLLSAARECNRLLAEALRSKNQDPEVCVCVGGGGLSPDKGRGGLRTQDLSGMQESSMCQGLSLACHVWLWGRPVGLAL